jgi:hypothetical protein
MYENTEFTLSRDCEAIQIPSGQKTTILLGRRASSHKASEVAIRSQLIRALPEWRRQIWTRSDWKSRSRSKRKNPHPPNGEVSEEDVLEPAPAMLRSRDPR